MRSCHRPSHPSHCGAPNNPQWLLPKVIAESKEHLRCFKTVISLPVCASSLMIRGIETGDQAPIVQQNGWQCSLVIPLIVNALDCAGRLMTFSSSVEIPCRTPGCSQRSSTLFAQASVRLINVGCSCGASIEVTLEIRAEIFRVRFQPTSPSSPSCPPAPPIPWYPQPCHPAPPCHFPDFPR